MMNQARRRWLLQGQDETVTQNTGDTGDTGDGTSQSALLTRDERAFDASLPVPSCPRFSCRNRGQEMVLREAPYQGCRRRPLHKVPSVSPVSPVLCVTVSSPGT